jgi:hypothetical protein
MSEMLGLIAALIYIFFALSTAALVWAVGEVLQPSEWQPGTNPHAWRF